MPVPSWSSVVRGENGMFVWDKTKHGSGNFNERKREGRGGGGEVKTVGKVRLGKGKNSI